MNKNIEGKSDTSSLYRALTWATVFFVTVFLLSMGWRVWVLDSTVPGKIPPEWLTTEVESIDNQVAGIRSTLDDYIISHSVRREELIEIKDSIRKVEDRITKIETRLSKLGQ